MNFRFSDQSLRIRLSRSDLPVLYAKGALEMSTRFPTGKRLRCGVRLARIPEGQKAEALLVSFTTEGGGFGADLVVVIAEAALQELQGGTKDDRLEASFQNPDGSSLHIQCELDAHS